MAAWLAGKGIRFKMTLVVVAVALAASVVIVLAVAFAMQSVMERSIVDNLSAHLDKAQAAVEEGDYNRAVRYAGSDVVQVIASDGSIIASSSNAVELASIVEASGMNGAMTQVSELKVRELVPEEDAQGDGAESGDSNGEAVAEDAGVPEPTQNADGDSGDDDDDDPDDEGDDDWDDDDAGHEWQGGASADDDDDDDDDGNADGDDDDADESGDDDADDDADSDDDDGADADSDSDDDDDADDDDSDDDGADATGKGNARSSKATASARAGFASKLLLVQRAFAAESSNAAANEVVANMPDDVPFVDASDVLGDDGPYLVMKREVESPRGTVTLAAMTSLAPAVRAAQAAAQLLAITMAVLLAIVAFAAWRLIGRTLRPVEEMRASVAAINEGDLSMRVAVPENDRDLAPLATTFNDLLGRIEASVDLQKRFLSDASHELKSPVAATGVMLEAMRAYPDAIDMGQVIGDLSDENERMGRIVGNMLVLARHDEGRTVIEPAPVDLMDVILEETARLRGAGRLTVDVSGVEPVVCSTDREQLGHILRNLVDNAARYAATTVKVSCEENGGVVRITVSDDGLGIPPADRERAFERFVRLEEGADRRKESTGLGLSVARASAEKLGGTVRFTDPEIGGATAVVELPMADPPTVGETS